jgi:hypothetical protein
MKKNLFLNFAPVLFAAAFAVSGCATVESVDRKTLVSSPEELSLPIGQPFIADLFNGTVYLSQLVGHDGVYNSPGMALQE